MTEAKRPLQRSMAREGLQHPQKRHPLVAVLATPRGRQDNPLGVGRSPLFAMPTTRRLPGLLSRYSVASTIAPSAEAVAIGRIDQVDRIGSLLRVGALSVPAALIEEVIPNDLGQRLGG